MILSVLPQSNGVGYALSFPHCYEGLGDNMNRTYLYVAAFVFVVGTYYLYGIMQYRDGWKEGRAALVTQQRQQAMAKLEKQITRQQQNDTRAAAAEQQGAARTVTITQEVVKYIKTPGRNVCTFDEARVKLKQAAVDNANHIEGYDHE
ncbi:spanin [Salmonella phage PhiSTP1]|nr:spanin [Salmonella phage PhiSTP1]